MSNIYLNDNYIINNPSLHEEDSAWKVEKILPLVDSFISAIDMNEINLLDVGGGAGLILQEISIHIENTYGIKVNKFAIDLSPGMLKAQKQNNPDLIKELNESIGKTSLRDKEIDLALMIDILEHVPNDIEALEELKRISDYVIFKIPLENSFFTLMRNAIKKSDTKKYSRDKYGHINFYAYHTLKYKIEEKLGKIISLYGANVYDYFRKSPQYNKKMKLINRIIYFGIGKMIGLLPAKLCLPVFGDFAVLLVKCY